MTETTIDHCIPHVGIEPSAAATRLAAIIMRRIKKGLDSTGAHIEPKFTGLSQLIEMYLIAAREEGCAEPTIWIGRLEDPHDP